MFVIYTTGIFNYGNQKDSYVKLWKQIYDKIKLKIPQKQKIIVEHYESQKYFNYDDEKELLSIPNSHINHEPFRIDKINLHHIVVDFAHIFKYTDFKNTVKLNNTTYPKICDEYKKHPETMFKINSVYTGYFADIDLNNNTTSKHKMLDLLLSSFDVDDNNNVYTYIDKMIDKNIKFDHVYPQDNFV